MWTVREVAERVGLPPRTVRYYDRIGLATASGRTEAGYRLYDGAAEGRMRFAKQARALGFSIGEVRELIAAAEDGGCDRLLPHLDRMLAAKISQLDTRIAGMTAFRDALVAYREGRGSTCGCAGHNAFCTCLADVPNMSIREKGGTRWLASVDAVAPAAHP